VALPLTLGRYRRGWRRNAGELRRGVAEHRLAVRGEDQLDRQVEGGAERGAEIVEVGGFGRLAIAARLREWAQTRVPGKREATSPFQSS
jgi:hypothetical protein